jgi:hypothetical protein
MSPTLGLDGLRSALSTPTHVRLEEGYRRLSLDARPDHGRHTALDCQERKCNCADAPLNAGALRMRLSLTSISLHMYVRTLAFEAWWWQDHASFQRDC